MKPISICGKSAEFLNVETGGTYNYRCILHSYSVAGGGEIILNTHEIKNKTNYVVI
jgi:hypothetical protein